MYRFVSLCDKTNGYAANTLRNIRFTTATLHILLKMSKFYFSLTLQHVGVQNSRLRHTN